MNVLWLWIIYIIVVIVLWLVLWIPQLCIELDMVLSAFVALIIGAIVIFLLSPSVGIDLNKTQSGWLSALLIIAYLLPILLLLWIILAGYIDIKRVKNHKMYKNTKKLTGKKEENCKFERRLVCDNSGNCNVTGGKMKCDDGTDKILYI